MKKNFETICKEVKTALDEDELVSNSIVQPEVYDDIKRVLSSGILDKDSDKTNSGICSKDKLRRCDRDILAKTRGECHGEPCIESLTFNIPLFLRLLEFAREDAKDDLALHYVVENCMLLQKETPILTMKDYEDIVSDTEADDAEDEKDDSSEEDDDYDYEDDEEVDIELNEKKKKKKKKNRARRMLRRGYGYIWPLYPMHMRPPVPPVPPPPKPPKPEEPEEPTPIDVPTVEPVADAPSASDISDGDGGGADVSVGATDVGGGAVAADGGDAGGAAGAAGAVGESDIDEAEEDDGDDAIDLTDPYSRETKNQIAAMDPKFIAQFVAETFGPVIGTPSDVSDGSYVDKIAVSKIYGAPDQSVFIKFKDRNDDRVWIVRAELDDEMTNFVFPDDWDKEDNLFSSPKDIKDKFEFDIVNELWTPPKLKKAQTPA